jgi:hypothetical protein
MIALIRWKKKDFSASLKTWSDWRYPPPKPQNAGPRPLPLPGIHTGELPYRF